MTTQASALHFEQHRADPAQPGPHALSAWLADRIAAFRKARQNRLDRIVLCQMDEYILRDIGISPGEAYGRLGRRP